MTEFAAPASEVTADAVLRALVEPRLPVILRLVAKQELAAGEISQAFEVTRTAVSQHLSVLKSAGLLTEHRDGTRRLYRVRAEGLGVLRELLDETWSASPNSARQLVETDRWLDAAPEYEAAG